MTTLPNLPLSTWDPGNAQPDLLYNALLAIVDALLPTPVVTDKDLTAPPGSPAVGSLYIVASPATGLWEGKEGQLVAYTYANAWMFIPPKTDWLVRVADEDANYRYDGSSWVIESGGGGGFTNPMTTAGDIIVGGSAGSPGRLALGADGTVLGSVAGSPAYVDVSLIPQNSKSAAYTLVLSDKGKHIYHPSADTTARTFTIPANASVAFPIGSAVTFVNDVSAGALSIAITSDTLVLAGAGTTGTRTLAAGGIATALKVAATRWIVSGTNLT